jgi:hypothetical protein
MRRGGGGGGGGGRLGLFVLGFGWLAGCSWTKKQDSTGPGVGTLSIYEPGDADMWGLGSDNNFYLYLILGLFGSGFREAAR